jgi:alanine racemase
MRTWLEIDFSKMKKNLDVVKGVLPEGCELIAVVKANAYGHGFVKTAEKLAEFGVKRFAVACISEAMELREAKVPGSVLVLGSTEPADAAKAAENDITLACVGADHFEALRKAAEAYKKELGESAKPLNIHVAVNTGMNRIGFDCKTEEQMDRIAAAYRAANGDPDSPVRITGIFSHFSSADDTSEGADPYTKLQLSRYEAVLAHLNKLGIDPGLRHISNSGGIGKYPQARFDVVRCGALIYGYNTAMDAKLPVEPAMEWKTSVTVIRTIDKGDAVSYSRKFVADGPRVIATLGIGYADGLSRALSNKGYVLINGCKAPMVGNICMDQMMVDITEIQLQAEEAAGADAGKCLNSKECGCSGAIRPVKVGDEAIIIGRSGDLVITADDVAEIQGSCMHEVLSTIGRRVDRIYK